MLLLKRRTLFSLYCLFSLSFSLSQLTLTLFLSFFLSYTGTDMKPMDFAIVDRHCILRKGADNALTLVGGDGETYHNGAKVENGAEIALSVGDRIVMASVMTMLYIPGNELAEMKTTEEIAQEYQKARMSSKDSGEMKALQAQKDAWEKQKASRPPLVVLTIFVCG